MTVSQDQSPAPFWRFVRRARWSHGGARAPRAMAPGESLILAPYQGSGTSRAKRILRRSVLPLTVLFCLVYGFLFAIYGTFLPRLFGIPPGIMAALIVWALPEMKSAPTRTMGVLFFSFMISLLLWPNYLAFSFPGLPWITMQRLIGGPMVLMFLISISVSAAFRARMRQIMSAEPWVWRLLIAFSAIQVVTLLGASQPFYALQKVIVGQMNWTVMFFVAAYVFMKKGRPTLWVALMCLCFIPLYVICFKEHGDSRLPWADHIPSFLKINDPAVLRALEGGRRDGGAYRIQATFSTALGLAEYCALILPFVIHYMITARQVLIKIACALAIPVIFQVILWTDARLGTMGGILACVLSGIIYGWHYWKTKKDTIIAPAVVISYPLLMLAFLAASFIIGRLRARIWGYGQGQYEASNQARIDMYHAGIPMIAKHPWGYGAGIGAGELGFTDPGGILTIDTYYLQIGLDYGVLGFVFYYGMMLCSTYMGGMNVYRMNKVEDEEQRLMIPLTVATVVFIFIKSVFSQEDNHPLIFVIMGMSMALLARQREAAAAAAKKAAAIA